VSAWRDPGVLAALAAAALFGAGTPLAKLLLGETSPWLLAGLLYLGSGGGLLLLRLVRGAAPVRLRRAEIGWLAGGILAGGLLGPVLLMWGLARMPAAGASLLLNAEGVATALIAWFVFRENFDRRIALGMGLIVAGALLLSWPQTADFGEALPALAILGACLAWAIDNNLTRKVALADAGFIAMVKGLVAGATNLGLALLAGAALPGVGVGLAAGALGFLSYGLSLVLFVLALRQLGTARTGAYFSVAPFIGAVVAVPLLGEAIGARLLAAGGLMALGVWLHVTERHAHEHTHEALEHEHEHTHDAHHRHEHEPPVPPGTRHSHRHRHESLTHSHPHFPDAHHRHEH
jgi:drug/metabolite transporter (DMT)-like permease